MAAAKTITSGSLLGARRILCCPVCLSWCPTKHHLWPYRVLIYLLTHSFLLQTSFLLPSDPTCPGRTCGSRMKHVHRTNRTEPSPKERFFLPFFPCFLPSFSLSPCSVPHSLQTLGLPLQVPNEVPETLSPGPRRQGCSGPVSALCTAVVESQAHQRQ